MTTVTTSEKVFKVLGYTEHVTDCDCCGRTDLKGTLALEDIELGNISYFGVVCGAKIAKSTTKVLKEVLTETEKENIKKAREEYRASEEYIADEKYTQETYDILNAMWSDDKAGEREAIIAERFRLGRIADAKKKEIAAKYFIKYTHKF